MTVAATFYDISVEITLKSFDINCGKKFDVK